MDLGEIEHLLAVDVFGINCCYTFPATVVYYADCALSPNEPALKGDCQAFGYYIVFEG